MNDGLTRIVDEHVVRAATDGAGGRVASELAAFARVVASSSRLAKALADPDVPEVAKRTLIGELAGSGFHAETVGLLSQVAANQRSTVAAFASLLVDVAAEVTFAVAEKGQRLEAVGTGLYEFAAAVRGNDELRDLLTNPATADDAKIALVTDLLTGKVDPSVLELVQVLISLDHGRDVDTGAKELARLAAERRNLVVAEVHTAVELDEARRNRMAEVIGRSIGKTVLPRFIVDPSIVGSVVVRVGDEVLDGSVRHRLAQARQSLVGAS